jgi:serine/threonine protein kinase
VSRRGARFELGSVVADRRIDSIAGEGGMGVVYRAWNLRLKRVEAVKVIGEDFVRDKQFRERFEREIEIAASLDHPNVVTVYDSGEGPGGQLFIAMQYVEGTSLDRLIRQRGRIEPPLAAALISQVADALDAAHGQGLVHRDVKPANIMIAENDGRYQAYLTDFGLAKRASSQSALTGVGMMVGTVDFMAPEQAGARAVDHRADIYALGATLFVALTGQVPYPGETDLQKLMSKMGGEPPLRPSELVGEVPAAFDAVIARSLAEDPADRYQSAGALATAARDAADLRTSQTARDRVARGGPPDPITIGTVVDGRYQIEAEAGSGGMAVVYRATHLKLAKTVAVKVMSPNLMGDPEFRRRFEDEARSASEIDHEHVIPVYDFGEDEHGLYIVMRFVDKNLRDVLRDRGPLEPSRAVQVIEQVASALDAAHERGLLHRDIKPANILVEESTGRIFLADFGLVRTTHDDGSQTGSRVLGTDWYMAPERRYREETKLGDIYSLGCVLWEMLAGPGKYLPGRSATPEDAGVPDGLLSVVERAISERPLERFQTAGDLARAARLAVPVSGLSDRVRRDSSPAFHEPLSSGLSARVMELCSETLPTAAEQSARDELEVIRRRLSEPLIIAVAGRDGAGKSTLVNALLGRDVAPETPPGAPGIVTWFRSGSTERVDVTTRDGRRRQLGLTTDGRLPASFGVDRAQISAIEVWLVSDALRSLTILDTPGLEVSANPTDRGSLGGEGTNTVGIQRSDALLFAIAGDAIAADREALEAFRRRFERSGHASAINAIGVLTKADLVVASGTSWEPAVARAAGLHEALGSLVTTVVAVASRIAQTVNTGVLTDEDVARLRRWAKLDSDQREQLLLPPPPGLDASLRTSDEGADRLLALLGRYGVRLALELADSGDQFNQVTLARRLREMSGIEELRKQIDGIQLRADALKADGALLDLESLSWRYRLSDLRNRVDKIRIDAPLLELMRLFDKVATGEIELDQDKILELERLLTGRTLAERLGLGPLASQTDIRDAAARRARTWRTWAGGGLASFQGQQVANKVDDVYMQIAFAD